MPTVFATSNAVVPLLSPDGDDLRRQLLPRNDVNWVYTLVTGDFTGGYVQVTNSGTNCTNQTFDVEGILGNVGRWLGGSGTGLFAATLTHHRHRVFGSCVTYAASVSGSITLTF